MNCHVCSSNESSLIKENFKYLFESFSEPIFSFFEKPTSNFQLDSRINSLAYCLERFYFSYRNESINDISDYTQICQSCVLDAIASLEDYPENCRRKIMYHHQFETVPIHNFPLSYLDIENRLDILQANALLESHDFNGCTTVEELIDDADISYKHFNCLITNHFKINLELIHDLPKDDFFYFLIKNMQESEAGYYYREQRALFYNFNTCQLAGATW